MDEGIKDQAGGRAGEGGQPRQVLQSASEDECSLKKGIGVGAATTKATGRRVNDTADIIAYRVNTRAKRWLSTHSGE